MSTATMAAPAKPKAPAKPMKPKCETPVKAIAATTHAIEPTVNLPPIPKLSKEARQADARVAALYKMLGDPTRYEIFRILGERGSKGAYVGEICAALDDMSQPAASHHIALLRHAGVIRPNRIGKQNWYTLDTTGQQLWKTLKGQFEART